MLKKVSPGEAFRPRASAWNEVIDKVAPSNPIPRTLPSLMPSQAMAMAEANTPAFVPLLLDPNPIKNTTSPSIPSYQLAGENTQGELIIGITLESSGAVNKPIRVCIQGTAYAEVTADESLDPAVKPPFAVYDSATKTLKTSVAYSRIRLLNFVNNSLSLVSIDNESTLLAKSSASENAAIDANRQSLGNISGLSFGTNLSCGMNSQEKQALAVDIGTRTTCTYSQTSSDGCTTETVTFEMSGEHALAIDGGLRVLLADEQRGSSQEYTDPTTGITSNGGPDKFVGGGLRITFDDPIPAISGITTPGLSIRLRDEIVGEPNQYYPDVLRHNANGLYIANEAETSFQGLDVMLTTNNNFGTMMPGKGLAVATSEITDTAEDGTQTTTVIPNYGIVDVQVCECTCLKINEANEIEFTGNINYEGGTAINVDERTINLQVCQGNGLIVNANNQLQFTGSGGGGATYTAGDYIGIDANNVICTKVCTCSLLTVTAAGELTTRTPCRGTALTETNFKTTLVLQGDTFPSLFKNATSFFGPKTGAFGNLQTAVNVMKGLDVEDCSTDTMNLKVARVKVDGTTIDFDSSGNLKATGILAPCGFTGLYNDGAGNMALRLCGEELYFTDDGYLAATGGGSGSSMRACQNSAQWSDGTEFGVKVAGGDGYTYCNKKNALSYIEGCYVDMNNRSIGYCTGILAVLVDETKGLEFCGNSKALQVKTCQSLGVYINGSGEISVCGLQSVCQFSGVPEPNIEGWVLTSYHPMLYHCGTNAIISYRQLMRIWDNRLQVSNQRAFAPGGSWEEYFGA